MCIPPDLLYRYNHRACLLQNSNLFTCFSSGTRISFLSSSFSCDVCFLAYNHNAFRCLLLISFVHLWLSPLSKAVIFMKVWPFASGQKHRRISIPNTAVSPSQHSCIPIPSQLYLHPELSCISITIQLYPHPNTAVSLFTPQIFTLSSAFSQSVYTNDPPLRGAL